jgi:hypothetical protein
MLLYLSVLKKMDGTEELLSSVHCSKINTMDGEVALNIYLLILHHFVISHKNHKQLVLENKETPYSSKLASKDGKGITFRVSTLPEDLQKIIVRYLKIIS